MWRSTPQLVGFCSVSASIWRAEGVLVMFFLLGGVVLVVLFVLWRRRRASEAPGPLAGFDTGVRSAYRTPARFFHNRRTL